MKKFEIIEQNNQSVRFNLNDKVYWAYYVAPIDQTMIYIENDESEYNERDAYSIVGAIAGRPEWIEWNKDIVEAMTIVDFESREVMNRVVDVLCDSKDYLGSDDLIDKALVRF